MKHMKEIFAVTILIIVVLLILTIRSYYKAATGKSRPLFTHECTYEVFQNNKRITANHKSKVIHKVFCSSHNAFFSDIYYELKGVEALPEFIEYQKSKEQ